MVGWKSEFHERKIGNEIRSGRKTEENMDDDNDGDVGLKFESLDGKFDVEVCLYVCWFGIGFVEIKLKFLVPQLRCEFLVVRLEGVDVIR